MEQIAGWMLTFLTKNACTKGYNRPLPTGSSMTQVLELLCRCHAQVGLKKLSCRHSRKDGQLTAVLIPAALAFRMALLSEGGCSRVSVISTNTKLCKSRKHISET